MSLNFSRQAHGPRVDAAYVLQHYEEGWTDGKWDEKYDERPCLGRAAFQYQEGEGVWLGAMWGSQLTSQTFSCVSVQGRASSIIPLLTKDASSSRSIYIGRAETLLHDEYGGEWYWRARRSMRFAVHLYDEAARYRAEHLASSDGQDGTPVTPDWRDTRVRQQRQASRSTIIFLKIFFLSCTIPSTAKRGKGGPYIAVHLRRNDFVQARGEEVPSLGKAAEQIKELLRQQNLTSVFIATDAPQEEFLELDRLLASAAVHQYVPPPPFQQRWGDGAAGTIMRHASCVLRSYSCQSHSARYFVGSYESTFSFRIQEEREILGFAEETTFNRLCGAGVRCEQPAKWKITY
ncbi:GDP-fucose protein O-fucosyltransferase 2 [Chionoecetes opilio]|uniref:GDP-fucose protein O-fucosyltransferase 2 n=1 Tax=Chionoecetes opilio TaxID=41210 RepID=A0A8J4YQR4_CHIOP|nr:GDP-fucose protein O-fucosyltransferase 2 [Chionoecetes opilio]